MEQGIIIKALSGFYYVKSSDKIISCRARGKFRLDGTSPLVGDRVMLDFTDNGNGYIKELLPRDNFFIRPTVANIDYLVLIAANVNPITDPFLIDRVSAIAEHANCKVIICLNKCDLDRADVLFEIYSTTGYPVVRTSTVTGEGIDELRAIIKGKTVAFTGNSGVGKSSILNALCPDFDIPVGEVSEKLGRGKHTTRHIELFDIGDDTYIADTPGFASFDLSQMAPIKKNELQYAFPEFSEYIGKCRFDDCAHLKEPGCAVLEALAVGKIHPVRHGSYARLYDICAQIREWEQK